MNCFFVPRRIERVPDTSTVLMRLPTTSRSRSRLIVSTSGKLRHVRPPALSARSRELFVRDLRRGLLGLLLRAPGPFAEGEDPERHARVKTFAWSGPASSTS